MPKPTDRAIAQSVMEFIESTDTIPLGHANATRGSQTYNWHRYFEHKVMSRAREIDAAAPAGAGALPDALFPFATEWYSLCERAAAVDSIKISGQLAEAIVKTVCDAAAPPAASEDAVYAARHRWLRSDAAQIDALLAELSNGDGFKLRSGNDLDAAVDAAIADANHKEN